MWKVNGFLWIFSLETGGFAIGIFHAISTFLGWLSSGIFLLIATMIAVGIEFEKDNIIGENISAIKVDAFFAGDKN